MNEKKKISDRKYKEKTRFGFDATEFVQNKSCEICGMSNEEHLEKYKERLHVHHKKNNGRHNQRLGIEPVSEDLMILCRPCHVSEDNKHNKIYTVDLKTEFLKLYSENGPIKIKCKGASSLPIDTIFDFQKNLKKITHKNMLALARSIFLKGFIAPFHIWDRDSDAMCLDGHQRMKVILAIREAGIEIPGLFPVDYIEADDEQDAREILLAITSQYGEFERDQLDEWTSGMDEEIKQAIRIVNSELKLTVDIDKLLPETKEESQDKECRQCPACGYEW